MNLVKMTETRSLVSPRDTKNKGGGEEEHISWSSVGGRGGIARLRLEILKLSGLRKGAPDVPYVESERMTFMYS
jgi:hypothetical protein